MIGRWYGRQSRGFDSHHPLHFPARPIRRQPTPARSDSRNRTALGSARRWPALADAGVALTRSSCRPRFRRARLRHGSRRSRTRKIGQERTLLDNHRIGRAPPTSRCLPVLARMDPLHSYIAARHVAFLVQRRRRSLSKAVNVAAWSLTQCSLTLCIAVLFWFDAVPRRPTLEWLATAGGAGCAFFYTHRWLINLRVTTGPQPSPAVWPGLL